MSIIHLLSLKLYKILMVAEEPIFFINFAGTPPTTVFSATSFVTTAPAAITAPSPMQTPFVMI